MEATKLEEYYKNVVDCFEVDGMVFAGATSFSRHRIRELIPKLQTRPDDVLLAGYPKCGNHWLKYILALIYSPDDLENVNKSFIGEQVEFLEVVSPRGGETDDDAFARWEASTKPRLWNTHLYRNMLPPSVREGKCKLILQLRNPKDIAVSFYKFHTSFVMLGCYKGTFREFLEVFFSEKGPATGSYFKFYQSYWHHRNDMLLVHFEDLVKDLRSEIKRIAQYLEQPLSEETIDKIHHMSSFAQMKKSGAMALWENMPEQILQKQLSPFMRKGEKGDWRNVFTVADNEYFDQEFSKRMAGMDLDVKQ